MTSAPADPLARLLARAFARGRQVHRSVALPWAVFAERVRALLHQRLARVGATASAARLATELEQTASDDLFLAIACDAGIAGAWEEFTREYVPRLRGLLRHAGADEAEATELAAALPGELIASPGNSGARTRLGTFDGSGSLFGWLSILVLRLRHHQRRAIRATSLDQAAVGSGVQGEPLCHADPAAAAQTSEWRERFAASLRAACANLTDQERLALALKYGHDVPQTAIARVLQVDPSRVSRVLAHAVDTLRAAGAAVPDAPGLDLAALWRALRDVVAQQLSTSTLAAPPAGHETPDHGPTTR